MIQEKQLAQTRPSGTTAASAYSPGRAVTTIIRTIYICNTGSSTADFSLYLDDDGTTYDGTTALYSGVSVNPGQTVEINTYIPMNNEDGNFAVQASVADTLVFSIMGAEIL